MLGLGRGWASGCGEEGGPSSALVFSMVGSVAVQWARVSGVLGWGCCGAAGGSWELSTGLMPEAQTLQWCVVRKTGCDEDKVSSRPKEAHAQGSSGAQLAGVGGGHSEDASRKPGFPDPPGWREQRLRAQPGCSLLLAWLDTGLLSGKEPLQEGPC